MSATANVRLIILMEHELREASRRIEAFYEANEKPEDERTGQDEERLGRLLSDALQASRIALHGAWEKDTAMVISSIPVLIKATGDPEVDDDLVGNR
jgi:hypothetical protein